MEILALGRAEVVVAGIATVSRKMNSGAAVMESSPLAESEVIFEATLIVGLVVLEVVEEMVTMLVAVAADIQAGMEVPTAPLARMPVEVVHTTPDPIKIIPRALMKDTEK